MKKNYFTIILLLAYFFSPAQDNYYWYKGKKIPLQEISGKVYITYNSDVKKAELTGLWASNEIAIESFGKLNINSSLIATKSLDSELDWAIIKYPKSQKFSNRPEFNYMGAFYLTSEGIEVGLSNLFYVKLKTAKDIKELQSMAMDNGVDVLGKNKYMPLWYTLSCNKRTKGNALQMANLFFESNKFSASEPDLMADDSQYCVNDTHFNNQWGLNNTGQYGGGAAFDINYCGARQISTGDQDIIVAVVDQGVEMNHPDLTNMHALSYDTESNTSPSQVLGNHGTAVAGIIGANDNNNLGFAGIAPDCPIMSISNSMASTPNSRQRRADGISFAVTNGASVINNSWGSAVQYQIIDDAIENAFLQGRGGKGCVVLFAAGNENGAVSYPANSNDNILTVGAMSPCGERKNPGSCDGENGWGSNFGAQLDVVAPGVLIPTTDRQGGAGYNTAGGAAGDYTQTFNGTSAATPHVAALAALILSENPDIDYETVNDIIESTAQKVGGYGYSTTGGRPNGTWDDEMGYGLINAQAALQQASFKINGATTLCPSANYSISPVPGNGVNINWSVSPTNAGTFSNTGTATTTFTRNSGFTGSATISAQIMGDHNVTVTKTINVKGSISISWMGTGPYGQVDVTVNGGSSPYKFYRNGSLIYTSYSNPTTVPFGCNGGVLKVEANTPCGTASDSDIIPSGCASMYSIYPNPTTTELYISPLSELSEQTISIQGTTSVSSERGNLLDGVELLLMDITGNVLFRKMNTDKNLESIRMDVSRYKKGIFFLRIIGKETEETHKIVIE